MELKQDTVDVDDWIERKIGWTPILLTLCGALCFIVGRASGKIGAAQDEARRFREYSSQISANTASFEESLADWADLHADALDEAAKYRAAYYSADKLAAEWERRAREKGE